MTFQGKFRVGFQKEKRTSCLFDPSLSLSSGKTFKVSTFSDSVCVCVFLVFLFFFLTVFQTFNKCDSSD